MGSQSFRLGDLVGLEGPAVLVGWVDNSASLQVGREESMGAILEVQVVGHLVGPGVGHPLDPAVGHLVDPEVGRLVDLEGGRLEDQVVGSSVTRRAGVDRARSSGRSGSEFGRTWLQRAGRCADSSFVSRI